jgi:L-aminopeptidase/D-esterase-like protein
MHRSQISRRQFGRLTGAATAGWWLYSQSTGGPRVQAPETRIGRRADESAGSLTDVQGIRVGHYTDARRPTGCTVILFDKAAAAGADYDGSAPGESLGVMLQPVSPLTHIHAILLTGGGPMGLGATAGVVRYLEERNVGYDWGVPGIRIPIVVGAVIDDLALGDGRIRPGPDEAFKACAAARTGRIAEGNVGVGSGATVGKMLRSQRMPGMRGGLGTVSARFGDVVIAALAVVNAAGDVLDWRSGRIIAGARTEDGRAFANTVDVLRRGLVRSPGAGVMRIDDDPLRATTLSIVATNAALDKTQLTKLAMMANTGAARAINPYHTNGDGDQVIAVSTGALKSDVRLTSLGAIAAELVADAIVRGVRAAGSVEGWTAAADLEQR